MEKGEDEVAMYCMEEKRWRGIEMKIQHLEDDIIACDIILVCCKLYVDEPFLFLTYIQSDL